METTKLKDLSFEAICGIIAKVIHNANKAYVDAIGGRAINPAWEDAGEEHRQGLIKAVASTIINPQTPHFSHEQWCLAKEKEGWTKDIKYDFNRKTHPNMVPFDQLTFEEQFKSHLYMGIASIFCGGLGILDRPEVVAARKILQDKWVQESEENKLDVEDDDDPVDRESTIALREKLQAAQAELDRLEAEQNAKDEEIKSDEPDQVINGVGKTHNPIMDGTPEALSAEEIIERQEAMDEFAQKNNVAEPEKPLPHPDEILDHKPKDFTAEDLAKDVLGADNVGEVTEGPKPNLPKEDKETPLPDVKQDEEVLPPKPKKTTKKKSADQGSSK